MIACKFGGTSVADGAKMAAVARLVASREGPALVVVSAVGKTTRELVRLERLAEAGQLAEAHAGLEDLGRVHVELLAQAGAGPAELAAVEGETAEELAATAEVLAEIAGRRLLTARHSDRILATGELLSSRILASVLRALGVEAAWIDPRDVMVTDDTHGEAVPDEAAIRSRVDERVRPLLARGRVVVTGGFVGRARDGSTTTLGWSGSDTTATVLGAALGCARVEIWKDVPGIATADPNLVAGTRTVPRIGYRAAAELALHGAQVIHWTAIPPAARAGVTIRVCNTFEPQKEGTLITREGAPGEGVLAIASGGPVPDHLLFRELCGPLDAHGAWPLLRDHLQPLRQAEPDLPSSPHPPHKLPPMAALTLVGSGLARRGTRELMGELGDDHPELLAAGAPCDTHRSLLVPCGQALPLLQRLHDAVLAGEAVR